MRSVNVIQRENKFVVIVYAIKNYWRVCEADITGKDIDRVA